MKKENARKVDKWFVNLEQTVKYLEECRNKGINVYVEFNSCGRTYYLYSCDTTIITAYLTVVGMTKEEREEYLSKMFSAKTKEEADRIASEAIYIQNQNKKIPFEKFYKMHIDTLKKEAVKVESTNINTIQEAIEFLEECRNKGINVYLDFNSVRGVQRFYSCDITIESAYRQIFNMSKEEVEEIRNNILEIDTKEPKNKILKK